MTKKDYVAIAQIIRLTTSSETTNSIVKSNLIQELCLILKADNSRFDIYQFKDACRCPTMDKANSF